MAVKVPFARRILNTFASVRTGIILLIIVGVVAAAGTVILQRPLTDPAEMQRAYSPQLLAWFDRLGLTDIFHAWWFAFLLALLSASIILASLERFPNAWRYFARPYRRPDPHFRAVLPLRKEIHIRDAGAGLEAAERALAKLGVKPERVVGHDQVSLYAERHRFAVLGAYVVHIALLLVLGGFIVDSVVGYKGFLILTEGQKSDQIEQQGNPVRVRKLPFSIRCDAADQENYPDGTPKKYWSKLTVLENGREVTRKEIIVNDPLVYRGIRFYQASFGQTEQVQSLMLNAAKIDNPGVAENITVALNEAANLDANTRIRLLRFIPDYYLQDNGEIYQRSKEVVNPAIQFQVLKADGKSSDFWMFPAQEPTTTAADSGYALKLTDLHMVNYTGLSVSHEPGQWGIWAGIVVMAIGLAMAFYFVYMRFWVVPVVDGKGGLVLWVGAAASKNREVVEQRFGELTAAIENELKQPEPRSRATSAGH